MVDWSSSFQQAITKYIQDLPDKDRDKSFVSICQKRGAVISAPDSLDVEIKAIRAACSQRSKTKQKVVNALELVVLALKDYGGIINTFTSADPIHAATVWGAVNVIVDCAHRHFEFFKSMQDQLEKMATELRRIKTYESLYGESPVMRDALCSTYISILQFWDLAHNKITSNGLKKFVSSLSSRTLTKLNNRISSIQESVDIIAKEGDLIEKARADAFREAVELDEILKWFNCPDCRDMASLANGILDDLRKGRTCNWLAENSTYTTWRDFVTSQEEQASEPILWLQANPGTGKSTLSSYIIDTIPEHAPNTAVAYYFYRFDQSFEPVKILKFLALRLFHSYLKSLDLQNHPGRRVTENLRDLLIGMRREGGHSETRIQELILALAAELPRIYFIIDGLDEERDHEKLTKLVGYLTRVLSQYPDKVHLWCSSQPHSTLITLRERTPHCLLDVDAEMTATVRSYLEHEVPNLPAHVSQEQKTVILEKLLKRVEGNFMWAKLVVGELSKAQSEGHIHRIIASSDSMDDYYERFFGRFMTTDRELACMIFALVAFAKRPLKIEELTDAVAMLRSREKRSLDSKERVFPEKLRELLSPLIIVNKDFDQAGDSERCRLVHSTVFNFLLRRPDILHDDKYCRMRVSPQAIADACLFYLNQERFSKLLKKENDEWLDSQGTPVKEHHFLFYSSKYWDKHLDHLTNPSEDLHSRVENFITSKNFLTCMQVQSLWVALQFAVFTKAGTDQQTKYFRRVFPDWFAKTERGQKLWSNYLRFVHEWKTLLCTRTGEIDRCWWGALGPHNFLSRHPSRYKTYRLQPDGEDEPFDGPMFQGFSPSGDEMKVLRMSLDSKDDTLTFTCEHWAQHDNLKPKFVKLQLINTTMSATNWSAYMYRTRLRTTVNKPSGSETIDGAIWSMVDDRAAPAAFSEDCRYLRIGAQVYFLSSEGIYEALSDVNAQASSSARYVEELAGRGPYVVLASRKAELTDPQSGEGVIQPDQILNFVFDVGDDDDDTAVEDFKTLILDKDGNLVSDIPSAPTPEDEVSPEGDTTDKSNDEDKDEDNEDEDEEDVVEETSSEDEDDSDDYATTGSEAHESWSECSSEGTADSQFEDEKRTPWASLLGQDAESETETSESENNSSPNNSEQGESDSTDSSEADEPEKSTAYDPSATGTTKVDESESSSEDEPADIPREAFFGFRQAWRDEDDDYPSWKAHGSDDDLDFEHRYIAHDQYRKKRDTQPRIFISVFDTSQPSPERIFTFSRDLSYLLHDSPPAIHPTAPLVVWPLSTGDVLFADFDTNSYFIRKLRPSTLYTRQIVMKFQFSPCGLYLHVASLEGQRKPLPRKKGEPRQWEQDVKLSLLVATYRLCKTEPSRRPPCLVHRVKIALGTADHTPEGSHDMLMYTMTWTPDALFFTCTDEKLRVHRVSLFNEKREPLDCKNFVHMPQETVYLPDSAIERKVYFFPLIDKTGDKGHTVPARVVISAARQEPLKSAYSKDQASPPLVCFLNETHLGMWQKSSICEEIPKDRGVCRFDEHLEAFNSEEDCDLEFYRAD